MPNDADGTFWNQYGSSAPAWSGLLGALDDQGGQYQAPQSLLAGLGPEIGNPPSLLGAVSDPAATPWGLGSAGDNGQGAGAAQPYSIGTPGASAYNSANFLDSNNLPVLAPAVPNVWPTPRPDIPQAKPSNTSGAGAGSAISPAGRAALTDMELDSTTASPDQIKKFHIDPQTRIYNDDRGKRTFGIGHLLTTQDERTWVPQLNQMTPDQIQQKAQDLYTVDLNRVYNDTRELLGRSTFDALSQNQKDALVIARFNAGKKSALGRNMQTDIRGGQLDKVPNEFDAWKETIGGLKIMRPGLIDRQLRTRAIWQDANYNNPKNQENQPRIKQIMKNGGY